jgi:glucosamine--fructose-6-phosphate aminotransferase (isomerizing)
MLEKGGYDHFMLKEIYEQPRSIRDCLRGVFTRSRVKYSLGGIKEYTEKLKNVDRIIIIGLRYLLACRFGGRIFD